jgi:hypothetical protein
MIPRPAPYTSIKAGARFLTTQPSAQVDDAPMCHTLSGIKRHPNGEWSFTQESL